MLEMETNIVSLLEYNHETFYLHSTAFSLIHLWIHAWIILHHLCDAAVLTVDLYYHL